MHYYPPDLSISPQNVLGEHSYPALRACERVMLTSGCRPRFTSSPHYGWSCLSSPSSRSMHRECSVSYIACPLQGHPASAISVPRDSFLFSISSHEMHPSTPPLLLFVQTALLLFVQPPHLRFVQPPLLLYVRQSSNPHAFQQLHSRRGPRPRLQLHERHRVYLCVSAYLLLVTRLTTY